jgi:hypothetical protein
LQKSKISTEILNLQKSAERYTFLHKSAEGVPLSAELCRIHLFCRFLHKSAEGGTPSAEILNLQKSLLQKGSHFLQISVNFCRKIHPKLGEDFKVHT